MEITAYIHIEKVTEHKNLINQSQLVLLAQPLLTAGWQINNLCKQEHQHNRRATTNFFDKKHTLMTEALHSWSRCFLDFLNLQLSSPVI